MCDPVTLSLVGAGITATASVASGVQQLKAGKQNQALAEANAQQEALAAETDIVRQQRERAQIIGAREAQFGASGVEQSSGSALSVLVSEIEQGQLDSEILRFNSQNRQENLRFQGRQAAQQGRFGLAAGTFNAAGTALSAAAQSNLFGDSSGGP